MLKIEGIKKGKDKPAMKVRNYFPTLLCALLIAIAFCAYSNQPSKAESLNATGYRLYQHQKYAEALEYFQKAIEADNKIALAHYNLACTLAIMRSKRKVCEYEAYQSIVMDHLEASVNLQPKLLEKAKISHDLQAIHGTFRYQKMIGRDPKFPSDLKRILIAITWYGASTGIDGPAAGLNFKTNSRIELWLLDKNYDKNYNRKRLHYLGTYKIINNSIKLRFSRAINQNNTSFSGILNSDGVLEIPNLMGNWESGKYFTDDPDECSA